MKIIFTSKRSLAILLFLCFGILFLVLPSKYLYTFSLKFVGAALCLSALLKLTLVSKDNCRTIDFVLDIIEGIEVLIMGVVVFVFYKYRYVTFVLGFVYSIIPILRLCFAKYKLNQFLVDSLKYLTIIILISSFNKTLMTRYIISSIFFSISIFIIITLLRKVILYYKEGEGYEKE